MGRSRPARRSADGLLPLQGRQAAADFAIAGPGPGGSPSPRDSPGPHLQGQGRLLQVFVNSVIYASEIAIMAVGVSLTFSILRFANFAHVQFAVVGGYLTYVF